jgi:hypothetical protein
MARRWRVDTVPPRLGRLGNRGRLEEELQAGEEELSEVVPILEVEEAEVTGFQLLNLIQVGQTLQVHKSQPVNSKLPSA